MSAAELFQLSIVKCLRAKAGAIYAEAAKRVQFFTRQFRALVVSWLNCIRRIQLQRDFRAWTAFRIRSICAGASSEGVPPPK